MLTSRRRIANELGHNDKLYLGSLPELRAARLAGADLAPFAAQCRAPQPILHSGQVGGDTSSTLTSTTEAEDVVSD